jgi:hypothetical protein
LNDAGTAQAASANPFSTLAGLAQAHTGNLAGIDQTSNLANLYYSSTHANQLGQEGQNYLGAQNTAAQNLGGLLSGDNQGVLAALENAHAQYLNELPNAYQRWVTGGGTGDGTTPPPTSGDGTTPPPTTGTGTPWPSNLNIPTGPVQPGIMTGPLAPGETVNPLSGLISKKPTNLNLPFNPGAANVGR